MELKTFQNEGIYCIINIINNEIYIGSSSNLGNRKTKHFSLLNNNKHLNTYLQNAVNEFGINNFEFKILEYTKVNLKKKENEYIQKLKPNYNIYIDLISNTVPLESRIKMSNTRKKLFSEGKLKPNCAKSIIQTDLDGNYINTFPSIRAASISLGIDRTSIQRVLYKKYKQMKGFIFHYEEKLPL